MHTKWTRLFFALAFGLGVLVTATAAQSPATESDHTVLSPGDLKWMPAPPVIPKGVQIAVLSGNPFAEGYSTVRLKIPPNTTFAPHWHPTAEGFTVLQGSLHVGTGDKVDRAAARVLPTMGYAWMPAMHHHYVFTGSEGAVLDLSFYGPFQIHYVNPADDPSKNGMKP